MGDTFTLEILDLSIIDNQLLYVAILDKTESTNAYYTIEHLSSSLVEKSGIWCFLFKKKEEVLIVYPFIKREIVQNSENIYYDVSSGYGYNGPLFHKKNVSTNILTEFWKEIDIWYKENKVISEFIRFDLQNNHNQYSGTVVETLKNVKGNLLETFEEQWIDFKPKVRNNYRKAATHGLTFEIVIGDQISHSHINSFYEIYLETMKRRNASVSYYFSKEYFLGLINKNKKYYAVAFVYLGSDVISTELIIIDDKSLYAFLGGTNAHFFSMRPNDFLRVEVIKWAIQNKFEYYILGGGLKDEDGLYKSKKAYFPNNEDVLFRTGRKILDAKTYKQFCLNIDPDYTCDENELVNEQYFPFYRK